jgi:hypothetical protein
MRAEKRRQANSPLRQGLKMPKWEAHYRGQQHDAEPRRVVIIDADDFGAATKAAWEAMSMDESDVQLAEVQDLAASSSPTHDAEI